MKYVPSLYNPNIGPNFQDYEAQAYGIGNTFGGSLAKMMDAFCGMCSIPWVAMSALDKLYSVLMARPVVRYANRFIKDTGSYDVSPGLWAASY